MIDFKELLKAVEEAEMGMDVVFEKHNINIDESVSVTNDLLEIVNEGRGTGNDESIDMVLQRIKDEILVHNDNIIAGMLFMMGVKITTPALVNMFIDMLERNKNDE